MELALGSLGVQEFKERKHGASDRMSRRAAVPVGFKGNQ